MKDLHNQLNNINKITTDDLRWMTERFVSVCYYALLHLNNVILSTSSTDSQISWFNIKENPRLIMDHNQMISEALREMREDFDDKLAAFALLPEKFTMKELQKLYEVVFGKPFTRNNFQKKITDLNIPERLEKKFTGAANKAPYFIQV
jgi:8-oxo-dGTP diphosphatase